MVDVVGESVAEGVPVEVVGVLAGELVDGAEASSIDAHCLAEACPAWFESRFGLLPLMRDNLAHDESPPATERIDTSVGRMRLDSTPRLEAPPRFLQPP